MFWRERLRLAISVSVGIVTTVLVWWLLNTDGIDEDIEEERW